MDQTKQDNGTKMLLYGLVGAAIAYASGRISGMLCVTLGLDAIMIPIAVRSAVAVIIFLLLGGGSWLRLDWKSIRHTWKFVRPLIIINLVLGCLTFLGILYGVFTGGLELANTMSLAGYCTLLCLLVGINEEVMFRGLALGGLLAKMGDSKSGIIWSAVISSIIFGAIHVVWDLDFTNGYSIATGAMKTLETSMFAFIFCYPVIKGRNLWGAITAHGFFDWIILCGNTIAAGGMEAPTYVSTDPKLAMAAIAMFAVMAVLYAPRTWRAVKELKKLSLPQYGPIAK